MSKQLSTNERISVVWGIPSGLVVFATILHLSLSGLVAHEANSLTLREALSATYTTNPSLEAARARLDATKELLAQAKALGRPNVTVSADLNYERDYSGNDRARSRVGNFTANSLLAATLQQPLFRGFSIANGIREAKAEIYAGHADLLQSEQEILLSAVRAYLSSWRYQSFVSLRQLNVSALREQVVATSERRRVGEATATDVVQSEARLAQAEAALSQTTANLQSSYADFERIIDRQPVSLTLPRKSEFLVPKSIHEALRVALDESPLILAAQRRRTASRYALSKVRGEFLPRADFNASYSKSTGDGRLTDPADGASVSARVVVPLYQGGDVYARVREATHVQRQRRFEAEEAKRKVESGLKSAWHQLMSLKSQIKLNRKQVDASRVALLGLLEQEKRGQRTTTDVLDAQQELTDAKIALVANQAGLVIAQYSLISTMGRLNAIDLELVLGK